MHLDLIYYYKDHLDGLLSSLFDGAGIKDSLSLCVFFFSGNYHHLVNANGGKTTELYIA